MIVKILITSVIVVIASVMSAEKNSELMKVRANNAYDVQNPW